MLNNPIYSTKLYKTKKVTAKWLFFIFSNIRNFIEELLIFDISFKL